MPKARAGKARAPEAPRWSFEADYFTCCNCDWGCPCTFNARPTQGTCVSWAVWRITKGAFGPTQLDGGLFALFYSFPDLVEKGNGVARAYVDSRAPTAQRKALETIATGNAGGGILELFAKKLTREFLPTKVLPITWGLDAEGRGRIRLGEVGEVESEFLAYPDGLVIKPWVDLAHGIEFKRGLMTNARSWWARDDHEAVLASHLNKYGAIARVKFTQDGCVG